VQVSRAYSNREKNNFLSVGVGKKSKNYHICVTERVKYLKILDVVDKLLKYV